VADPDECQQGRLKIHTIVHIIPNNEKKSVTMRKCSLLSKYTKTSFGVSFYETPCFSKFGKKKKYQTGTDKFNIIPDRYSNISFKKLL